MKYKKITVFLFFIQMFANEVYSRKPQNRLKGFIWMAGAAKGHDKAEKHLQTVDRVLKKNKYLSGVFISLNWEQVEPEQGRYDWNFLDELIALVQKNKKIYKLGIKPGISTPEWVYEKGAQKFETKISNPNRSNYREDACIPIPWDRVYLKYYKNLLKKISRKYGKEKYFTAIALAGVNFMSVEMHLPRARPDIKDNSNMFSYKIINKYKDKLHHGFQSLAGFKYTKERQGSMEMAVYNFIRGEGEYRELWHGDGKDSRITEQLHEILLDAERMGPDKYKEKLIKEDRYMEE